MILYLIFPVLIFRSRKVITGHFRVPVEDQSQKHATLSFCEINADLELCKFLVWKKSSWLSWQQPTFKSPVQQG